MSLGNQDGVPLEKLDPLMSSFIYTTCTPSSYMHVVIKLYMYIASSKLVARLLEACSG